MRPGWNRASEVTQDIVYSTFVIDLVHVPADIYRLVVLAQAVIVVGMYAFAGVRAWRTAAHSPDLNFLRYGRLCRDAGILIVLGEEMMSIWARVGQPHFNWETPIFQVVLIMLILAWHLVDRRIYRVPDNEAFTDRLNEVLDRASENRDRNRDRR